MCHDAELHLPAAAGQPGAGGHLGGGLAGAGPRPGGRLGTHLRPAHQASTVTLMKSLINHQNLTQAALLPPVPRQECHVHTGDLPGGRHRCGEIPRRVQAAGVPGAGAEGGGLPAPPAALPGARPAAQHPRQHAQAAGDEAGHHRGHGLG